MMKRIVLWAVLVMVGMCGVPCMGQGKVNVTFLEESLKIDNETGDESFVLECIGAKGDELWVLCRRWLAESVESYSGARQMEDREHGVLICNYVTPLYVTGLKNGKQNTWKGTNKWKMTLLCKDDRLKVVLTRYIATWSVSNGQFTLPPESLTFSQGMKMMGQSLFVKQYTEALGKIAGGISDAFETFAELDNF